jgi:hypothetical protein
MTSAQALMWTKLHWFAPSSPTSRRSSQHCPTARQRSQPSTMSGRFPSGHGGFLGGEYGQTGDPDAFTARLREVLDG